MTATCALCSTPTDDAAVCSLCVDGDADGLAIDGKPALARNLGDVPALAASLADHYTRQARHGDRVGGRSAGHPIPWDERARRVAGQLRSELTTDVRLLDVGDAPRWATTARLGTWLLGRLERVRHHADAAGIVTGVARAVNHARVAVDAQPDRWYAGPCWTRTDDGTCGAELYVAPGVRTVRCPGCHTAYDVVERRSWLLGQAHDTLANAALLGAALPNLGQPVTADRIRHWADRGRLERHGHDQHGHPLYRVGDVIQLLTAGRRT